MAVIANGAVIQQADKQTERSTTRVYPHHGVPTDGTTYAGIIQIGEFLEDVDTGNLYEYTEPSGTPTYTRIDTV